MCGLVYFKMPAWPILCLSQPLRLISAQNWADEPQHIHIILCIGTPQVKTFRQDDRIEITQNS